MNLALSRRLLLVVGGVLPITRSRADASSDIVSVRYFGSFGGYDLPLKPVEPLSEREAKARKSYCIGYFSREALIRFERYVDGKLFFRDEYEYAASGKLARRRMLNPDGVTKTGRFDENGKYHPDQ